MAPKNKNALILFARDPVPGKVKTRLQPLLGPLATCELFMCFLEDSLSKLQNVSNADGFIGIYPSNDTGFFNRDAASGLEVFEQDGRDLGERMKNAFQKMFDAGYQRVVIIGSDSPSLPVPYIEQAFVSEKDMALGPSSDGGYYLIGMNKKVTDVFENMDWGTEGVLKATLQRVTEAGASVHTLPVWYDVDRPEDLHFLNTHLDLLAESGEFPAPGTREILKQFKVDASE